MARLTSARFRAITEAVIAAGYQPQIDWCESLSAPVDAEAFASEAIYVIVNSGMHNRVARAIFERCMAALRAGESCRGVYGHSGKAAAIDRIWGRRDALFVGFAAAEDQVAFCGTSPATSAATSPSPTSTSTGWPSGRAPTRRRSASGWLEPVATESVRST